MAYRLFDKNVPNVEVKIPAGKLGETLVELDCWFETEVPHNIEYWHIHLGSTFDNGNWVDTIRIYCNEPEYLTAYLLSR